MYATVGIFELIKIAAIAVGFVSAATDSSHCCFMKHSLRLFRPYTIPVSELLSSSAYKNWSK